MRIASNNCGALWNTYRESSCASSSSSSSSSPSPAAHNGGTSFSCGISFSGMSFRRLFSSYFTQVPRYASKHSLMIPRNRGRCASSPVASAPEDTAAAAAAPSGIGSSASPYFLKLSSPLRSAPHLSESEPDDPPTCSFFFRPPSSSSLNFFHRSFSKSILLRNTRTSSSGSVVWCDMPSTSTRCCRVMWQKCSQMWQFTFHHSGKYFAYFSSYCVIVRRNQA